MNPLRLFAAIVLSLAAAWVVAEIPAGKNQPKKTFFIGNSITYYHQMPEMLSGLFAARKVAVKTDQHTPGGSSVAENAASPEVKQKISDEKWDYVVVQDSSRGPMSPQPMIDARNKLCESIVKKGAMPVVFVTWGYWGRPSREASRLTEEQLAAANAKYCASAKVPGGGVAPVGPAWQMALDKDPKNPMHIQGDVPPTPEGSYLAACVIFATISGQPPLGLPSTLETTSDGKTKKLVDLKPERAKFLQEIALEAVNKFSGQEKKKQEK